MNLSTDNFISELMEKNSDKSIRLCDSYCKCGDIILKIKINMIQGKETDLNEIVKSLKELQQITKAR